MIKLIKAKLILAYEISIPKNEKEFIEDAVIDKDEQALWELFGIGYESPVKLDISFSDINNES